MSKMLEEMVLTTLKFFTQPKDQLHPILKKGNTAKSKKAKKKVTFFGEPKGPGYADIDKNIDKKSRKERDKLNPDNVTVIYLYTGKFPGNETWNFEDEKKARVSSEKVTYTDVVTSMVKDEVDSVKEYTVNFFKKLLKKEENSKTIVKFT